MTPEQQAREWAEKAYPINKGDEYLPGRSFITEDRKKAERAYLAGYAASGEWVSVEDRLPEPGAFLVVGSNQNGIQVVISEYNSKYGFISIANVTHWQPLPSPPNQ